MKSLITSTWQLFKATLAFIVGIAVYAVVGVAFGAFMYILLPTLGGF